MCEREWWCARVNGGVRGAGIPVRGGFICLYYNYSPRIHLSNDCCARVVYAEASTIECMTHCIFYSRSLTRKSVSLWFPFNPTPYAPLPSPTHSPSPLIFFSQLSPFLSLPITPSLSPSSTSPISTSLPFSLTATLPISLYHHQYLLITPSPPLFTSLLHILLPTLLHTILLDSLFIYPPLFHHLPRIHIHFQ